VFELKVLRQYSPIPLSHAENKNAYPQEQQAGRLKMPVPITDVSRSADLFMPLVKKAIDEVVDKGWYILGENVKEFEASFADYCNVKSVVGVGNGTDALELALRALGVGEGDEIITTANACMFGTVAILATGAKPVYADINPLTGLIDPASAVQNISSSTRAIIATHLFGKLADISNLKSLIDGKNIYLIEDAAQAHGARTGEGRAGALADVACFSFYPTKNLGALGDGGAIATDNDIIASKARKLRQYGWNQRFECQLPGGRNSRLDELQAAVLLAKLPFLDELNRQRREIASQYIAAFSDLPVSLPVPGDDHVFHLFVMQHTDRNNILSRLQQNGITADIHYPVPDYRQEAVVTRFGQLPHLAETEKFVSRILTLPCFPGMTEQEINLVIEHVRLAVLASAEK
jgi:dTDP-3-amino-2,3,6-trideoxy-4-keto-D-glucose/dTDP-3-amino-3,4,6-trideoxy-alpha-D-glucose/dTDP-2,6-dideoxy-D-kanosamine transaminase